MATNTDVLALGSVMVEITPAEAGASLRETRQLVALPGGASCNSAAALARLGVRVSLATGVGEDEWGEWLADRLAELGIDTSRVRRIAGQLTTISFCWVDRLGGKRFYFYRAPGHSDPIAALTVADIRGPGFESGRFLDFGEAAIRTSPLREIALETVREARAAGMRVCYAANYRPASWGESRERIVAVQREACALAEVVVMNREEAALIAERADPQSALESIAALGPRVVAVTGGEEGSLVAAEGAVHFVAPRQVEVVYDVGAGDVFHAGLLAGLVFGRDPLAAAEFGSDAAALWISRPADLSGLPTRAEVEAVGAKD